MKNVSGLNKNQASAIYPVLSSKSLSKVTLIIHMVLISVNQKVEEWMFTQTT
jgi:hypothetical protein